MLNEPIRNVSLELFKRDTFGTHMSEFKPFPPLILFLILLVFLTAVPERPDVKDFDSSDRHFINTYRNRRSPIFATKFCDRIYDRRLVVLADEDGMICIYDACNENFDRSLPENSPKALWQAHHNAIFDVAWADNDSHLITASGDLSLNMFDTTNAERVSIFRGHTGSVKCVAMNEYKSSCFASGGRDGNLLLWDARISAHSTSHRGFPVHQPVMTIQHPHNCTTPLSKRRASKTPTLLGRTPSTVTSVVFNDNALMSGCVDGIISCWDMRKASHSEAICRVQTPVLGKKTHGITSLSVSPDGNRLLTSLTGGHHLLYDIQSLCSSGPTHWFGGHTIGSFYVKSTFSPDGTHIASGSTDGGVYIWQIEARDGACPFVLRGHSTEVTGIAWSPSDWGTLVSTGDDGEVRFWRSHKPSKSSEQSCAPPYEEVVTTVVEQRRTLAHGAEAHDEGGAQYVPSSVRYLGGLLEAPARNHRQQTISGFLKVANGSNKSIIPPSPHVALKRMKISRELQRSARRSFSNNENQFDAIS